MKNKILPILALTGALLISGCGGKKKSSSAMSSTTSNPDSQISTSGSSNPASSGAISSNPTSNPSSKPSSSSSSQGYNEDDEEYPVNITATEGVTAQVDKRKAKKGETVTLTFTVQTGFKVLAVNCNGATLTKVNDTKYTFVMGERPVRISFQVEVAGDFTIVGDFSAVLQKVDGKNLYVARDVRVPKAGKYANFSYSIKVDGVSTKLDSKLLDEGKCFANVTHSSSKDHALCVATGATYDFYYEPGKECPCYVIRTSVDELPQNGEAVYTALFEGRYRSEPTIHPQDLKAIEYSFESSAKKYTYNYKKYVNDTSLAVINDTTDPEDTKNYYVYKHADFANNIYEVVNTWSKQDGNNENEYALWNLDPNRKSEGPYGQPFAARVDIVPNEASSRYEVSERHAARNVAMGAHYGGDLEYEFYSAYRSIYSGNVVINAPSATSIKVDTTPESNGEFTVVINSMSEYNHESTGSTADATMHEAHINQLTIKCLKNGAVKELTCVTTDYAKSQWNFGTHEPLSTATGSVTRRHVVNTYGEAYTGAPDFDKSKYFISSIENLGWYNSMTELPVSQTVSNVNFGDVLEIVPYAEGGKPVSLVKTFNYTPATALDVWQYGVETSSNEKIVYKNPQGKYQVDDIGECSVVISNRTQNSNNVKKTVDIKSVAKGTVRSFYIDCTVPGVDSYGCDHAEILEARAGRTTSYAVRASLNTGAPISYSLRFDTGTKNEDGYPIMSDTSDYVKVVQTGKTLILDCDTPASNALTETKVISVTVRSQFYQPNQSPSKWTIRVNPTRDDNIIGTRWIYDRYVDKNGNLLDDTTKINFSNEEVSGYDTKTYKGTVIDTNITDTESYVNTWNFVYQQDNLGKIFAKVTSCTIENPDFKGVSYTNFYLYFDGVTAGGLLKAALFYVSGEEVVDIFGYTTIDEENNVNIESWLGFTKR